MESQRLLNIVIYFTLFSYCRPKIPNPNEAEAFSCRGVTFLHEHTKWNKSIPPKVYQESYCAVRCSSEGKRFSQRSFEIYSQNLHCLDCSCKRPECEYYGICCPSIVEDYVPLPEFKNEVDYLDNFYGNSHLIYTKRSEEIGNFNHTLDNLNFNYSRDKEDFPKLGCFRINSSSSFLYIISCLKDFKGDSKIIRFCEQNVSNDQVTIDYFTWIVDTATHVVYRNMYCALCNRAIKPQQLAVRTYCKDFMPFYQITDPDEMLRKTLDYERGCCETIVDYPDTRYIFSCNRKFFEPMQVPVSTCDSAPPEWHYDEDIARACQELNNTTYRMITVDGSQTYTNIFCAICNMNSYPLYEDMAGHCPQLHFGESSLPFSLLINFGKVSTVMSKIESQKTLFQYANCSNMEWSSPDTRCLPLVCSPGKILFNESCSSAFKNIDGLRYRVRFWLFRRSYRNKLTPDSFKTLIDILIKVQETLINDTYAYSIQIGYFADNRTQIESTSTSDFLEPIIWVDSYLTASKKIKRDDYEKQLLGKLIDEGGNFKLHDKWNIHFPIDFFWRQSKVAGALKRIKIKSLSLNYTVSGCGLDLTKSISVTRHLFCSYIAFRPSHYNITVDSTPLPPEITVTVDLNVTKVNISTMSELNMIEVDEEGNLKVCHEVMGRKLNEMEDVYRRSKIKNSLSVFNLAQYIVTMTSLGCSVVCLILTMFTYLWLPILQNTAGNNNILLCLSLMLAQTSLAIIAHRPREDIICKLTGIVAHFLWLWMFSWTFICSFHMFNVFTSSTRIQPATKREEKKQLMKRIIFSFIGPTVIVVSVIVVSVISSGGENIGYSHITCYLNSTVLIGCSVIFPVALSLACNITFFMRTVFSINKVRRLQTSQVTRADTQQDLIVYVKLSSMTGVSWTLAIVAEAADVDTLRTVSIVLNGFQGVFIFLSYICNKRIFNFFTANNSQTMSTHIAPTPITSITELN